MVVCGELGEFWLSDCWWSRKKCWDVFSLGHMVWSDINDTVYIPVRDSIMNRVCAINSYFFLWSSPPAMEIHLRTIGEFFGTFWGGIWEGECPWWKWVQCTRLSVVKNIDVRRKGWVGHHPEKEKAMVSVYQIEHTLVCFAQLAVVDLWCWASHSICCHAVHQATCSNSKEWKRGKNLNRL